MVTVISTSKNKIRIQRSKLFGNGSAGQHQNHVEVFMRPALDVQALSKIQISGSLFDPVFLKRLEHRKFLSKLSSRISRPIVPDDKPSDYLVTQAIADYLSAREDLSLGGIIYRSVWGNDYNVALFHKSSLVKKPKGSEKYKIEVNIKDFVGENEYVGGYSVFEEIDSLALQNRIETENDESDKYTHHEDNRDFTLNLDRGSLVVHLVDGVKINTTAHRVSWHKVTTKEKDIF